jgi:hypothetical protein
MPFKIRNDEDGYWDPPRPDVQNEDIAMEEGPTSPRVTGRFLVNQPWLDKEWGQTASGSTLAPVGGKRKRSEDKMDPSREMMAAMRKPGAGGRPLVHSKPSSAEQINRLLPVEFAPECVVVTGDIARAIERRSF